MNDIITDISHAEKMFNKIKENFFGSSSFNQEIIAKMKKFIMKELEEF